MAEPATPSQTVGPFFAFALPFAGDANAVEPGVPGAVRVEGQLIDGAGEPVPDGLLEAWVGDQFARCGTDSEGMFHFVVRKPAQGPDGAVFTTAGEGDAAPSVWVMNEYDAAARRVRYTIFHPGVSTGEIAIVVAPAGDAACTADVTYRFTALTPDGDASIARWVAHFPHMAPHWEGAINARLGAGHP